MQIRTLGHKEFVTKGEDDDVNGSLSPSITSTTVFCGGKTSSAGLYDYDPARHDKRAASAFHMNRLFTCIKGNVRVVLTTDDGYQVFFSDEDHEYRSTELPTGVAAAVECMGDKEAYLLNIPTQAWTPDMQDEHSADFSDFDFGNEGQRE